MANSPFAITPNTIQKVVGGNWNNKTQMLCYMANGIAYLSSDEAKAQFVAILSDLGIKLADVFKRNHQIYLEVFNTNGRAIEDITDEEKRMAIAEVIFRSTTFAHKFDDFDGDTLDALYKTHVKDSKKADIPYQLYRITIGEHVIYRISNVPENYDALISQAIRYLIQSKRLNEDEVMLH